MKTPARPDHPATPPEPGPSLSPVERSILKAVEHAVEKKRAKEKDDPQREVA